jgi:hypothetical protein
MNAELATTPNLEKAFALLLGALAGNLARHAAGAVEYDSWMEKSAAGEIEYESWFRQ